MSRIDEEIGKLVEKHGQNDEVLRRNLDFDLHFFSVFVIQQYREAMRVGGSYAPEGIRHG
jgi:hypothetical protein